MVSLARVKVCVAVCVTEHRRSSAVPQVTSDTATAQVHRAGLPPGQSSLQKSLLAWSELTLRMIPSCKRDQSPAFLLFAFCLGQINAAAGDTQGSKTSLHPCCTSHQSHSLLQSCCQHCPSPGKAGEGVWHALSLCPREMHYLPNKPDYLLNRQARVLRASSKSGWVHPSNCITQCCPIHLFIQNHSLQKTNEKLKQQNPSLLPAFFIASKTVPVTVEDKWDYFKAAGINYEYKCYGISSFPLPLLTCGQGSKMCAGRWTG